jgi:hypothetical protein
MLGERGRKGFLNEVKSVGTHRNEEGSRFVRCVSEFIKIDGPLTLFHVNLPILIE